MTSSDAKQTSGAGLTSVLTAIQHGVTAINNLTQTMKSIFPSS